ncbi:MAG TPA: hypothetical protein VHC18_09780, partial [Amycolatopsis sp.]|nr:hypothetical protein [Amycolatopsis sp.]
MAEVGALSGGSVSQTTTVMWMREQGTLDMAGSVRVRQRYRAEFVWLLEPADVFVASRVRAKLSGSLVTGEKREASTGTVRIRYPAPKAAKRPLGPPPRPEYRRLPQFPARLSSTAIGVAFEKVRPAATRVLAELLGAHRDDIDATVEHLFTPGQGMAKWLDLVPGNWLEVARIADTPDDLATLQVRLEGEPRYEVVRRYGDAEYGPYQSDRYEKTRAIEREAYRGWSAGVGIGGAGVGYRTQDGTSAVSQSGVRHNLSEDYVSPQVEVRVRLAIAVRAELRGEESAASTGLIDVVLEMHEHEIPQLEKLITERRAWELVNDSTELADRLRALLAERQRLAEEAPLDLDAVMADVVQQPGFDPQAPERALAVTVRALRPDQAGPGGLLHVTSDPARALAEHHVRLAERLLAFLGEHTTARADEIRAAAEALSGCARAVLAARAAAVRAKTDYLAAGEESMMDAAVDFLAAQRRAVAYRVRWIAAFEAARPLLTELDGQAPFDVDLYPGALFLDRTEVARGLAAELSGAEATAVEVQLSEVEDDGFVNRYRILGDGQVWPLDGA